MKKNIQIPISLFTAIVKYFLVDIRNEEIEKEIKKEISNKLDAIIKHDLYTKYKTAPTEQEREEARQKYLDSAGIHKDFRW